jgi:putative acetyltransferase
MPARLPTADSVARPRADDQRIRATLTVVDLVLAEEDPRNEEVVALLEQHLAFAHAQSPPEHVHALDLHGLVEPGVTFFTVRDGGELVAIGALHELDPTHAELKSMHTRRDVRGRHIGRTLLEHLVAEARRRGYRRISLETGTGEAFAPAHALYTSAGFVACEPFAHYSDNPHSACMTMTLGDGD